MRARVWNSEAQVERSAFPTMGEILKEQTGSDSLAEVSDLERVSVTDPRRQRERGPAVEPQGRGPGIGVGACRKGAGSVPSNWKSVSRRSARSAGGNRG